MADTGVKYPTSVDTVPYDPESNNDWTNPQNVCADDATKASITSPTFDSPDISYRLICWGFDLSAIPDGATIDGVFVEIDHCADPGEKGRDYRVQLWDGTWLIGDNKADTENDWPDYTTIKGYGGATDGWGASLTSSIVKSSGFGVVLSAQAYDTNTDIYVDCIRMTVYYTPPEGPTPDAYNKILYTSEPPTPNAWNQVKQEAGTGWRKLLYV